MEIGVNMGVRFMPGSSGAEMDIGEPGPLHMFMCDFLWGG